MIARCPVLTWWLIIPRWVAGWSGWQRLADATRAVRGWSMPYGHWIARYAVRTVRRSARYGRRAVYTVRAAARWLWRLVRPVLQSLWRWAEPSVKDAAGWLAHTAPRFLVGLLGRLLRRSPVILWRTVRLAAVGSWWLLVHYGHYLVAYSEYGELLAEAESEHNPRRALRIRHQWRRASGRRLATLAVLLILLWLAVRLFTDRYGWPAVVALVAASLGLLAGVGRLVRGRQARTPEEKAKAEGEPFPIADAHTRAQATECVSRALKAGGIELRGTGEARRTPWGWEVPVILQRGTPAVIVDKLGELETTLDLPSGGVLAASDRSRRARVVLRLAERDPFASVAPALFRAPLSVSIRDTVTVATRMDGSDLGLCLLGVHGVIIGNSGSGKSVTLRTLADSVTACRDAIVWDLDPAGDGIDALDGAIARKERSTAGIQSALAEAVAVAEVRPKLFAELGMSRVGAWQPDHERPALVVIVDEYHHLTPDAKQLAVRLLRIGRKARVSLILAAAEATSDTLGHAIADTTALKILLACRHQDVRLTLGQGMIAEGWRPDRLNPATGEKPEDAGRCYIYAAGARDPIISHIRPLDTDQAHERGVQRAQAGLPRLDTLSWERAHNRRNTADGNGSIVDHHAINDVINSFGVDLKLWTEEVLARLAALDTQRYGTWSGEDLAAMLRPLGVAPRGIKRDGRNRNGYYRDVIITAYRGLT